MVIEGSSKIYYDTRDALIMVQWRNFTVYLVFTSRVYLFLMFCNNLSDNDSYNIAFNLLTFHHQKWSLEKASTYTHTHMEICEGHVRNGEYFVGFSWEISKILVSFFYDSYIVDTYKCIPLESYFVQFLHGIWLENVFRYFLSILWLSYNTFRSISYW